MSKSGLGCQTPAPDIFYKLLYVSSMPTHVGYFGKRAPLADWWHTSKPFGVGGTDLDFRSVRQCITYYSLNYSPFVLVTIPKTGMSWVSVCNIVLINACSITNDRKVVVVIDTFPSTCTWMHECIRYVHKRLETICPWSPLGILFYGNQANVEIIKHDSSELYWILNLGTVGRILGNKGIRRKNKK